MGRRVVVVPPGGGGRGPVPLVALGIAASAVVGVLASFRAAGLLLALVLALTALARAVLPVAALGPLAVRSRTVDVVTALLLAGALAVLAVVAPGGEPHA